MRGERADRAKEKGAGKRQKVRGKREKGQQGRGSKGRESRSLQSLSFIKIGAYDMIR